MSLISKLCLLFLFYCSPVSAATFGCAHEVSDLLALGGYLNQQVSVGNPSNGKLVIELYNRQDLQQQFANVSPICIEALEQQTKNGKFQAKLSGTNITGQKVHYNLHGTYQYLLTIPVVKHPIRKGEIITKENITTIEISEHKLTKDTVLQEKPLVGQVARNSIASHQPISQSQVSGALLTQKNHPVTLQYENEGILIKVYGKALNDASNGELVRVRNSKSGTIVEGIAIGPNLVRVGE